MRLVVITLLLALLLAMRVNAEAAITSDHVRVSWLAPSSLGATGEPIALGVFFEVEPHWHVYWRNPGDSGAAPRFAWQGNYALISEPLWPFPTRLPVAHLTNLGYEGDVAYVFEVQLPQPLPERLQLQVDLEWLVCSDEECLPGFGRLSLDIPVSGATDAWQPRTRELLTQFQQRIPDADISAAPWQITDVQLEPTGQLLVRVNETTAGAPAPALYPLQGEFVSAALPQLLNEQYREGLREQQWRFALESVPAPSSLGFVLAAAERAWEWPSLTVRQVAASAPVIAQSPSTQTPTQPFTQSPVQPLWWLLLLAFVGGAILNLMPCVFPVLSIKVFSLIKHQHAPLGERLREGLAYTGGVMFTFALLGLGFLLLRAAGAGVGWGFQLQSPWVVLALALLFWLMALSFMGALEFGQGLMSLAGRSPAGGSFATGVLAVFVAAPCTGPFMGAALGASASLPPLSAMAIFLGLGAGLAAPFLLLAASPRLAALLPKPGPWMERLRQLLAFPLFASVLWLLWVLDELLGGQAWLRVALLLLLVSFSLWLGRGAGRVTQAFAWLLALLALVATVQSLSAPAAAHRTPESSAWQGYNPVLINQAQAEARGVFIDYTAAWCITCQVNKKRVLDTAAAQALFAAHNTLLVRADWTRYDERITQALAQLGRNSVPVYVYYAPGSNVPQLLPQILTLGDIRELFSE